MRLKLKNFRYHREETFDLPDQGMVLIRGERGSGKSTILNGIFFALYGKFRRPYSHGANTCSVEFEDSKKKITIVRSCRPNRLIVTYDETVYEDETAQGVIEQVYGMNMDEFQVSSYFDQKKHGSILSMTPSEQLRFVELIAFVNGDHEEIKSTIKSHSKDLEKQQTQVDAQLALLRDQVRSREHDLEKHKSDDLPKDFNVEEVRREYEEATHNLRTIKSSLNGKRNLLAKLREDEVDQREMEDAQRKLEIEIEHYSGQRSTLGECLEEEQIEAKSAEAAKAREMANNLEALREVKRLEIELETLFEEHFTSLASRLEEMEAKLISDDEAMKISLQIEGYDEARRQHENAERERSHIATAKKKALIAIGEAKKTLISTFNPSKTIKTAASYHKFLQQTKDELKETISDLEEKLDTCCDPLECPKCQTLLDWDEDEGLVEHANGTSGDAGIKEEDIPDIEMQLASAQMKLSIAEELITVFDSNLANSKLEIPKTAKKTEVMSLKDFQSLSLQLSEQNNLKEECEKIRTSIAKRVSTPALRKLEQKVKEKMAGIPDDLDDTKSVKEAIAEARKKEDDVDNAWRIRGEYTSLTREIETRRKQLRLGKKKFLKPNKAQVSSSDVEAEIFELENLMTQCSDKIGEFQSKIRQVESYEARERAKTEIINARAALSEKEEEAAILENRLKGAYGLEKASIDAEFLALEKTIGSINEYAKIYLEQMFEDDISAKLTVKKFTKKGDVAARPTIQVQVHYNGATYDDIDDLSGGERQQCDLAFLLAVNDMLGSNVILLDECLNNLDADVNLATLNFLHDFCGEKQILVVAHEAVTGVFDQEIVLERK